MFFFLLVKLQSIFTYECFFFCVLFSLFDFAVLYIFEVYSFLFRSGLFGMKVQD